MHRWLARELEPRGLAGRFGHDAAVLVARAGRTVLCTDQAIEGVHAERGVSGRLLGRKACARALSDLAATAARPVAVLLAMALDPGVSEAWIRACVRAVRERARDFGADLVGGDLAASQGPARLCVTACGLFEGRGKAPGRERARPGQVIVATGRFGGSRAGRHLKIEPRVALGHWLAERGATAMLDVSDGLALDLARLARASGVRIDLERVPIHADALRAARASGRTPREHALEDGEDHELLAALPRAAAARLAELEAPRRAGAPRPELAVIGRVRRGRGLWLADQGGPARPWSGRGGWIHGE